MGLQEESREGLLSFFTHISEYHLREFADLIHELSRVIEYETESEEQTMDMFKTLLWKATNGMDMVRDGRNRPLMEDYKD